LTTRRAARGRVGFDPRDPTVRPADVSRLALVIGLIALAVAFMICSPTGGRD
jgi:hypothetical protein